MEIFYSISPRNVGGTVFSVLKYLGINDEDERYIYAEYVEMPKNGKVKHFTKVLISRSVFEHNFERGTKSIFIEKLFEMSI